MTSGSARLLVHTSLLPPQPLPERPLRLSPPVKQLLVPMTLKEPEGGKAPPGGPLHVPPFSKPDQNTSTNPLGPHTEPSGGSLFAKAKVNGGSPEALGWRPGLEEVVPGFTRGRPTAPAKAQEGPLVETPENSPLSDPKALNGDRQTPFLLSSKPEYFCETRRLLAPPGKTWWRTSS
ncbi:hypothetical protein J1605_012925 [Eschrichtius robustus]|uniref:Uncharacterized protein n=1 Tax=Eschrichtius robustus TaxID=9764 RepID=A0AB34GKZ6_ESCRO|nr:hypothetical protein J1605_012925 [Eschrichtius robustus]